MICGRDAQVVQAVSNVELQKFPVGDLLDVCGQLPGKITLEHLAGLLTAITLYHALQYLRLA